MGFLKSGLQIATNPALDMLNDYHNERMSGHLQIEDRIHRDEVIKLSDMEYGLCVLCTKL